MILLTALASMSTRGKPRASGDDPRFLGHPVDPLM